MQEWLVRWKSSPVSFWGKGSRGPALGHCPFQEDPSEPPQQLSTYSSLGSFKPLGEWHLRVFSQQPMNHHQPHP
ncbi:Dna Ligase 4 [Manis pentadactyla]|nr:Dna Ligase 4 [Manis pentadactyla]